MDRWGCDTGDEPLARRAESNDEAPERTASSTEEALAPPAIGPAAYKTKRGELRIYLGAAPGVGKTYAMLGEAHRRLERGTDVVAAVVETHGRKKTAELLDGIETVPPRYIEYRGSRCPQLDVPAVLARHPQVVLVDELAHTNTPGSKNPKRWQDVEELLDAGITVISTVNVQHLESLNDVVTQITGTRAARESARRGRPRRRPDRAGRHHTQRRCGAGSLTAMCMGPRESTRR